MVSELIDKYIWLIRIFSDAGTRGLTLDELSRKWERRYCSPYARRTFNNHREAINDVFGIEIRCNRSDNSYYIPYADEATDRDSTRRWLIDTFTVNSLLSLGKERLTGRVSVQEVPSGHKHLTGIMNAMLSDSTIELGYCKYSGTEGESFHVDPYAVKEADKRWYLVGWCHEREAIRVYGLDRITSMSQTGGKFRMPANFDVDALFAESYGMYLAVPAEVRNITFRCDTTQARYLQDLPLHPSQTQVCTENGMVTFAIRAAINNALVMDLCKLGDRIEIISPQELRHAVKEEHKKALKLYES